MALIIVNSLNDGGVDHSDDDTNLTLRDAIVLAAAGAGADEIVFADNLAGTIALTSGALFIAAGNNVTINGDTNGDGNPDITLDGASANGHIDNLAAVSLTSLRLVNGYRSSLGNHVGGSINNYGNLSIAYCDFADNEAVQTYVLGGLHAAGAIYNGFTGTLSVTQSTFTGGTATAVNGAAGTANHGYAGGSAASGIVNVGTLTISHTVIEAGTATGGAGGNGDNGNESGGYDGGAGGHAVHGILNFGTITAGSGVQNRSPGILMSGAGGAGGLGDPGNYDGTPGSPGNTYTGNSGGGANLADETNNGTSGDDTESFGDKSSFYGLNGNDTITAGYGSTIHGGAGNDTIANTFVKSGSFNGGIGSDTLDVSADHFDDQTFDLSTPSFSIFGATFTGFENVIASQGNDIIAGNGNGIVNRMSGGLGNDSITGSNGDIVEGGAGNDTVINTFVSGGTWDGGADSDTLDVSADNLDNSTFTFDLSAASFDIFGAIFSNFENVIGSLTGDNIIGSAGINKLDGHAGDDTIKGGGGGDMLKGGANGAGGDTLSYEGSSAGVTVNLHLKTATGGDATGDTISGFENVTGSAKNDTIAGNSKANVLAGGLGKADILSYADSSAGVRVDLAANTVAGGHGKGDTISGFERVTGSAFGDTLKGSDAANRLDGGDGDDFIFGSAGADLMSGGRGHDTLDYTLSVEGTVIDLSLNLASGGGATGDTISRIESVKGSNNGNDTLTGESGANTLEGGGGNDTIEGGAGGDLLSGGAGIDTLSYASSTKGVTVDIGLDTASGSHATGDKISGFENLTGSDFGDTLTGNSAANTIDGGAGSETLNGGGSGDRMIGGAGKDNQAGGTGNDTFVFNASSEGSDTITDFSQVAGNNDSFELKASGFGGGLVAGALLASQFQDNNTSVAANGNVRVIYNQSTGQLFFDADGSADTAAVLLATLSNNANLALGDFTIV